MNGALNGYDPDTIIIDHFEPDYSTECQNCMMTPCVTGVDAAGKVLYHSEMCGPCTFGTAAALDPDWWNKGDE